MQTNSDYRDLFAELNAAEADYLVVGALALAAHGHVRATRDLDVWIRSTPENAERVYAALASFGAPLKDLTVQDLATPDLVVQIGVAPVRIDIITSIDGVSFDEAWPTRVSSTYADQPVHVISRRHLIRNKKASGRLQDLADDRRSREVPGPTRTWAIGDGNRGVLCGEFGEDLERDVAVELRVRARYTSPIPPTPKGARTSKGRGGFRNRGAWVNNSSARGASALRSSSGQERPRPNHR